MIVTPRKLTIASTTIIFTVMSSLIFGGIARAEDSVDISVGVAAAQGAPTPKVLLTYPLGKKSDGVKIKVGLLGLEPGKTVLVKVSPLPDAIARLDVAADGSVDGAVELPYGLEPGPHEVVAATTFGSEDTPATYTLGTLFVNDFGVLTDAAGKFPKGTKPMTPVLSNSLDRITGDFKYLSLPGSLRVGTPLIDPQLALFPSFRVQIPVKNELGIPLNVRVRVTLLDVFGNRVGQKFETNLQALESGEERFIEARFKDLPPTGIYNLKTQLILPDDFKADIPIQTSYVSGFFVPPVIGLLALIGFIGLTSWRTIRARNQKIESR